MTIIQSYKIKPKYQIDFAPEYIFDDKMNLYKNDKKCNKVICGGSVGYYIRGKFYSLTRLTETNCLIEYKEEVFPF